MKDWSIWLAAADAAAEPLIPQLWPQQEQRWTRNSTGVVKNGDPIQMACVDTNQMANMYVCHNCCQQQWTKVTTILCCRHAFDFQQQEKFLENRTRVGQKRGRDTTNIKWSKCMCAIMEVHHSGQKWPICYFPCALQCCGRVRQRKILLRNPGQAI